MNNANPSPGYDIDEFIPGQTGIVQFQVHVFNFQTTKNQNDKFEYNFQMVSFYMV